MTALQVTLAALGLAITYHGVLANQKQNIG